MIEWLVDYQRAAGWTDAEMAAELGIGRQHWNRLKAGRARVGVRLLARIVARFPLAVAAPVTTAPAGTTPVAVLSLRVDRLTRRVDRLEDLARDGRRR